jgi:predicted transport protein
VRWKPVSAGMCAISARWGTGDLELCLRSMADFERAKPLIERSYGES